jgi:hypothetical protein
MKHGQIWSTDFTISVSVFIIALALVLLIWRNVSTQSMEQTVISEMQKKLLQFSDSIVRIKGIPESWNENDVEVVGLSSGADNVLDADKVSSFVSLMNDSYDMTKSIMGIGEYGFYFALHSANGSVITNTSTPVLSGQRNVFSIDRHCLYKGRVTTARFIFWSVV